MFQEKVNHPLFALTLRLLLKHSVPELTVSDLASNYDRYQVIDARNAAEYKVSHLAEARHWLGIEDLAKIRKDRPVLVYCSIGLRSEKTAQALQEQGYKAYNLYGGIFEWVNREQRVYNEQGPTEAIHGYNALWSVLLRRGTVVFKP